MAFEIGETVICRVEIKDDAGVYKDPDTSIKITIKNLNGLKVVDAQTMSKDAVGRYHYDYNLPSAAVSGTYTAEYVAIDGARTTIERQTFEVTQ